MKKLHIRIIKENLSDIDKEMFELLNHRNKSLCICTRQEMIDDFPEILYNSYSKKEAKFLMSNVGDRPEIITLFFNDEEYALIADAITIFNIVVDPVNSSPEKYKEIQEPKKKASEWVEDFISKINSIDMKAKYLKQKYDPNSDYWKT